MHFRKAASPDSRGCIRLERVREGRCGTASQQSGEAVPYASQRCWHLSRIAHCQRVGKIRARPDRRLYAHQALRAV